MRACAQVCAVAAGKLDLLADARARLGAALSLRSLRRAAACGRRSLARARP